MQRRVVITGMGIGSCLGTNVAEVKDSLYMGKSGIGFISTSLDGHTSAVEAEWEERVLDLELLVPGGELSLGHSEGMTQVETAVHVRIREGDEVLLAVHSRLPICRSFSFINVVFFPQFLHLKLNFTKFITLCGGFGSISTRSLCL